MRKSRIWPAVGDFVKVRLTDRCGETSVRMRKVIEVSERSLPIINFEFDKIEAQPTDIEGIYSAKKERWKNK